jgi:hypothetical protein
LFGGHHYIDLGLPTLQFFQGDAKAGKLGLERGIFQGGGVKLLGLFKLAGIGGLAPSGNAQGGDGGRIATKSHAGDLDELHVGLFGSFPGVFKGADCGLCLWLRAPASLQSQDHQRKQ